jgi:hypothetical protein
MLTVNLEKRLIKQNKSIVTAKELLKINEYEQLAVNMGESEEETLSRIGMATIYKDGKAKKLSLEASKKETSTFNQERVFHISQIKSLCNKYSLKFLPSYYYKGTVDSALPLKVSQFEIANDVKVQSSKVVFNSWSRTDWQGNTERGVDLEFVQRVNQTAYIMAPKGSFELTSQPKDPLFFYKINEEYYYLIHKWGDDLSILRRISSFCRNYLFGCLLILLAGLGIYIGTTSAMGANTLVGQIVGGLLFGLIGGLAACLLLVFPFFRGEWEYNNPQLNG